MSLLREIRDCLRPSDHPVDRLLGWTHGRGKTTILGDPIILAMMMAMGIIGAGWVVVLLSHYAPLRSKAGVELAGPLATSSYVLLLIPALLAPSVGSKIRSLIDRSPLLIELLGTPVSGPEYAQSIARRALLFAIATTCLYAVLVWPILLILGRMGPTLRDALHESLMGSLLSSYPVISSNPGDLPGLWLLRLSLFPVALTLNYGAGVRLRMLQLARIPRFAPAARLKGGFETARILFLAGLAFVIRMFFYAGLFESGMTSGLLWFALCEVVLMSSRLIRARIIIEEMERDIEFDHIEYVLREEVIRPPTREGRILTSFP